MENKVGNSEYLDKQNVWETHEKRKVILLSMVKKKTIENKGCFLGGDILHLQFMGLRFSHGSRGCLLTAEEPV